MNVNKIMNVRESELESRGYKIVEKPYYCIEAGDLIEWQPGVFSDVIVDSMLIGKPVAYMNRQAGWEGIRVAAPINR